MDRKSLKLPFVLEKSPDWECPECGKGVLRFKKDSFFHEERARSREGHSHDAWEPEWIEYVYSGLLVCTNDQCREPVATGGTGTVDWSPGEDENGMPEQIWSDHFRPKHFTPHLKLFKVPENCPSAVAEHINRSFGSFFSEPQASANSIRVAVEALLTDLGVRRFDMVNGKRRFINLHRRIALLPAKYDSLRDLIFAIKWLGNAGSHDGRVDVTMDDVMDSYELMEHILQEVYEPKLGSLKKLAKTVNKRKGPARRA